MATLEFDVRFRFFLFTPKCVVEARVNGIRVDVMVELVEEIAGITALFDCKFAKLGKLFRSSSVKVNPRFPLELFVDPGWLLGEMLAFSS